MVEKLLRTMQMMKPSRGMLWTKDERFDPSLAVASERRMWTTPWTTRASKHPSIRIVTTADSLEDSMSCV